MNYDSIFDESGLLCRVNEGTLTGTCKKITCEVPLSSWTPKFIA